jgi:ribosomal protein S27AE
VDYYNIEDPSSTPAARMMCAECGTELHDPPVAIMAENGRPPCPKCGATRRTWAIDIGVSLGMSLAVEGHAVLLDPPTAEATAEAIAPHVSLSDPAWRRIEELATATTARMVLFHEPSEDGTVLCEVREEDGTLLDAKPGRDAEDALLNAAAAIVPEKPAT